MSTASEHDREEKLKLIEIVREVLQHDNELREKYQIGEKFRFVRERLNSLLSTLEQGLPASGSGKKQGAQNLGEDETLVFVYLYNAQGLQLHSWQNLVNPKVFYEYSVNRPIYGDKASIESLLRSKTNKAQHGYITVAVKKEHVLKSSDGSVNKDIVGNPVIKVKEGSLHFDKVISFTHQDQDYEVTEDGELIKKTGSTLS